MIGTREWVLPGVSKKTTFNFLACKFIFNLYEHCKFFITIEGNTGLWENLIKFIERWKFNGAYKNIRNHWFWNGGLRHLLHTSIEIQENFKQSLSFFYFLFFRAKKIAFKCSLDLHFYALIIGFFRLT